MAARRKDEASGAAGLIVAGREANATEQNKVVICGEQHISKLRKELAANGLALRDASGLTQRCMLLLVLKYLGSRGINTPKGVGCGFYRIATRIQELEAAGWIIGSQRETIVGHDRLAHIGIARCFLVGKFSDMISLQLELGLEA